MNCVVGYLRVSSEEQTKGFSLQSQRQKIEDYARFKEWNISKFYNDEGISGTSIAKRKSFQEMIKDAREKKFSVILISKFDRAFRSVVDALTTIDELHKLGIDIVSVSEDIDTTTAMGKAMFTIISAFAQLESERNSERVRDVRLNQFERGVIVSRVPFGYSPVFKDKKNHRGIVRIEVNEKEAEIIRKIFQRTADGDGYKKICGDYKIKPQSYYNIIKNKIYIGIVVFEGKETKGIHEPIISQELWDKVNK